MNYEPCPQISTDSLARMRAAVGVFTWSPLNGGGPPVQLIKICLEGGDTQRLKPQSLSGRKGPLRVFSSAAQLHVCDRVTKVCSGFTRVFTY